MAVGLPCRATVARLPTAWIRVTDWSAMRLVVCWPRTSSSSRPIKSTESSRVAMAARSIRSAFRSERCCEFSLTTHVQRRPSTRVTTSSMGLRRTCLIAGNASPDGEQPLAQRSAARQLAEAFEVYIATADDHAHAPAALCGSRGTRGCKPQATGRLDDELHTGCEETHALHQLRVVGREHVVDVAT